MKKILVSLLSVVLAVLISLSIAWIMGESPLKILKIIVFSSFGSFDNFSYSLFYSTPLIFTGLSVALAAHGGLFNVGGEGQLYMGSLFLTVFALQFPSIPYPFSILLGLIFAMIGGGLWGSVAGLLKAKRGSHEVIATIMLNFISYGICGFMILGPLKSPTSQNPETAELSSNYFLKNLTSGTPLNTSFFLAVICAVIVWFLLYKTTWGFEIRMLGKSPETAKRSGVPVGKRLVQLMFLSGAMSSLVSINEILGSAHKYKDQYSPNLGFVGIAVALLAQNKPVAILFSAVLFGALSKGALDLELDTEKITRDMALMIQGFLILMIAGQGLWKKRKFYAP